MLKLQYLRHVGQCQIELVTSLYEQCLVGAKYSKFVGRVKDIEGY